MWFRFEWLAEVGCGVLERVAEEDILPDDKGFFEEIRGVDAMLPNEDGLLVLVTVVLFIVVGMIKGVV